MGLFGYKREGDILRQTKKAQGETNERLDRIIELLVRQNELLGGGANLASSDDVRTAPTLAGPTWRDDVRTAPKFNR